MSRIVVEHEVDRDAGLFRQPSIILAEELQELLAPVPPMALADDFTGGDG